MATNWICTVTDDGASLFSRWLEGGTVNFSTAQGGTGTVPEAELMHQSTLADTKQELSIIGYERKDEGIRISVQITAHDEEYTINQIGLYASIDGGEPVMAIILQDDKGLDVPDIADSPDFIYKKFILVRVSNIGDYTVTIDTSAVVSRSTLDDELARKQDIVTAVGILKGDGAGAVTSAAAGDDYGYPTIIGNNEPGTATAGFLGQHYLNTGTGDEYVCLGMSSNDYIWKLTSASDAPAFHVSDSQPADMQPGDLLFKITG